MAGNAGAASGIQWVDQKMPSKTAASAHESDSALVQRIAADDHAAFERLMRRHNSRLFRIARAILKDDAEAEDAVQDGYLDAYRHIADYRGEAQVTTWLTRIVINQALMRLRRHKRERAVVQFPHRGAADALEPREVVDRKAESPATAMLRSEIRTVVESRIDELPAAFRAVFVMRDVEEMTMQETADCLGIPAATVRTRLFRARALLRESLARDIDTATLEVFGFAGERCDRIIARVIAAVPPR
jgi:RNA polymerase sigma-70 factor (ECF subfamily)